MSDLRLSDLMDTIAKWDRQRNLWMDQLAFAPMLAPPRPQSVLGGMSVYYSEHVGTHKRVQVRFPKSKKKRIVMKWFKDPKNWESWLEPGMYILNGRDVVMHPSLASTVREAMGL